MKFVLFSVWIILSQGGTASISTHALEFDNKAACEAALKNINAMAFRGLDFVTRVSGKCLPKG